MLSIQEKALFQELRNFKLTMDESAIVSVADGSGLITYANDMFCRISKYRREELIGQDHRILNSGYHPKAYMKELWETILAGRTWRGNFRNRAKDGSIYWVSATIMPFFRDSETKPFQFVAIRHDITRLKQIEEELGKLNKKLGARVKQRTSELKSAKGEIETSLSLLKSVMESRVDGIMFVDRDGKIESFNQRLLQLSAAPRELAENGTVWDLLRHYQRFLKNPESAEEGLKTITKAPEKEFRDYFELTDGRVYERHSMPRWVDGECVGRIVSIRDISDLRKLESKLRLAERLATIGAIASGVAHEINNPLTFLVSNLELMHLDLAAASGDPSKLKIDELRKTLEQTQKGAQQIRAIAQDLKNFSRVSDERKERFPIETAIEAAINLAGVELKHRTKLIRDFKPTPEVFSSEPRLCQVFVNLLVNAAQAMPEGRTDGNLITVSTRQDETGRIVAEVSDNGSGIPPELLNRIFDPFFTTKRSGVGTGLGLSICQSIVTSLDGELQVESAVGKGTAFRVVLPPG